MKSCTGLQKNKTLAICEHDFPSPSLHPKQWADKTVPFCSVIIQIFTKGSFIHCECRTHALTTYFPVVSLPTTEVSNPATIWLNVSKLLKASELLDCIVSSLKYKITYQVRDFKHSGLNWSAGILAGSIPTTEIFCRYFSFTRPSKALAYSESTGSFFLYFIVFIRKLYKGQTNRYYNASFTIFAQK